MFQTRIVSGVSMSMIISFPDAYRLNSHHVLHLKYPIHTIDLRFLHFFSGPPFNNQYVANPAPLVPQDNFSPMFQ